MKKRFTWIAVVIIAAAVCSWYLLGTDPVKRSPESVPAEKGVTVGKTVPVFTLPSLNGKSVSVGDPGRITVINFWATWCPPCREEMPELDQFARQHQQTVAFQAVNIQEPSDKVKEFLQQYKYSLPVLLDNDGAVAKMFRINAIPTTIVVDKNGIIKYRKSGGVTMNELEGVIKGL